MCSKVTRKITPITATDNTINATITLIIATNKNKKSQRALPLWLVVNYFVSFLISSFAFSFASSAFILRYSFNSTIEGAFTKGSLL